MAKNQKIRLAINGFGRIGRQAFKIALEIYHGSSTRDSLAEQVLRGSFDRYGKVFVGGEEGDQGREFTFSMSPEDVRTAQAGVNEVLHKIGLNGVPRAPVLWKRR